MAHIVHRRPRSTKLQQLLNNRQYQPLIADGVFGSRTEVPVRLGWRSRRQSGPTYGESNAAGTTHATGLDCSGFTRWAYAKAFGYDRLGSMGAQNHAFLGKLTTIPQPGDLVLYAARTSPNSYHHIAIYLGGGTKSGRIAQERTFGSPQVWGSLATTPAKDR